MLLSGLAISKTRSASRNEWHAMKKITMNTCGTKKGNLNNYLQQLSELMAPGSSNVIGRRRIMKILQRSAKRRGCFEHPGNTRQKILATWEEPFSQALTDVV